MALAASDQAPVLGSLSVRRGQHNKVTTLLDEDLRRFLEADAQAEGSSISEVVRNIVTRHYYGSAAVAKTQTEAILEVKQTMYTWLRFQIARAFRDWEQTMPEKYEEIRKTERRFTRDFHANRGNGKLGKKVRRPIIITRRS